MCFAKKHEFLNAGVASYSSYIYQKKIITILEENPWIKADMIIVLLDKSDLLDDLDYLDRPEYFSTEREYKFVESERFTKDLKANTLIHLINAAIN